MNLAKHVNFKMLKQNNSVLLTVQSDPICFWASNFLRGTLKERKESQSNWVDEAWLCSNSFYLFLSLYYRERQSCSLCGCKSLGAGLQAHATLGQATLCYRNISILIIVPLGANSECSQLCCYTAYFHGKYIHIKPHIALFDQLEKNAQYHLNHLKCDFSSQICTAQSKVEHCGYFVNWDYIGNPNSMIPPATTTITFYFSRCSEIKSLILA